MPGATEPRFGRVGRAAKKDNGPQLRLGREMREQTLLDELDAERAHVSRLKRDVSRLRERVLVAARGSDPDQPSGENRAE